LPYPFFCARVSTRIFPYRGVALLIPEKRVVVKRSAGARDDIKVPKQVITNNHERHEWLTICGLPSDFHTWTGLRNPDISITLAEQTQQLHR